MRRVPGLVSRVPGLVSPFPGLLEPCLPSLCFFLWSIRVSGLHQGSGILGLLFPFIVFLLVRDLFPGFRDFWNFVSHHCFCFVVHQGPGLHQGSGILGLLSPIIVFFLVVYQGSGIFGTLSPIIVFVLWSIRARDFIRVPGFLDFCFPSLCFFWFRDLSPEYQDLSPGSGTFGTLSPIIVFFLVVYQGSGIFGNSQQQYAFGFQSLVAGDWYLACAPSSEDAQGSGTCLPGSGTFGTLSPIIVFLSMVHQGFGASSGFRDSWTFVSLHCVSSGSGLCLPSLFLFCGPSGRGTSSGFRDSWTFVSHHCVFSCGLSGLRDFWNLVSHHCVCSVVHQGAGLHQGSGILGLLFPIIVFLLVPGLVSRVSGLVSRVPGLLEPCLPSLCFFLWFIRAPGFWKFVSHHCVCSVVHQGAGLHQGSGILGLLSPIIVFFLVVYQGSRIFGTLSPIIVFVLWSIRARDFIRVPGFLDFCFPSLCFFWFRDLSPEFQDLSPGFRDLWNLVSHHCVFSCGL